MTLRADNRLTIKNSCLVAGGILLLIVLLFIIYTRKSDDNPLGLLNAVILILSSISFSLIGYYYLLKVKNKYPKLKNIYDLIWVIISIIALIVIYNKSNDQYINSSIAHEDNNLKYDIAKIQDSAKNWLLKFEKSNLICSNDDEVCINTITALKSCAKDTKDNCIRSNAPYAAPFFNKIVLRSNQKMINDATDELFILTTTFRNTEHRKNLLDSYERKRILSNNSISLFALIYPFIFSFGLGLRISKAIDDVF